MHCCTLCSQKQIPSRSDPASPRAQPPVPETQKGRLQVANAFSVWARLSAASSSSNRHAGTALSAKRHKTARACLSALRANASLRRRARLALASLDRRCRLRRLTRGWGAVSRAAAAGSAERRAALRLGRAEAAVAAGRLAARARAHRTARRLLGVARGRAALEAFVAWRGLVREGRGARLGAAALAGRCVSGLGHIRVDWGGGKVGGWEGIGRKRGPHCR